MTGITKDKHGIADLMYVPLVWAAPSMLGFMQHKKAVAAVRAFPAAVLAYSLFTDAPWGVWKKIPYKTHAVLDLSSGLLSFAAPYVLKLSSNKKVRNTFFAMGAIGVTVGILSIIGAAKNKSK